MYVQDGEAIFRNISINVEAPQDSVLSAILLILYLYFLPRIFMRFNTKLFADELAIIITGSIEKRSVIKYRAIRKACENSYTSTREIPQKHFITSKCEQNKSTIIL